MLIDAQNRHAGWCSIDEAAATRRAFAVELADVFLALDCDDESSGESAELAEAELTTWGLAPVLTASGRSGHRHLFARIADRGLLAAAQRAFKRVGTPRSVIRPPLAPHRSELPVGLLSPQEVGHALECLAGEVATPLPLPPSMHQLLSGERRRRSRSEGVAAILLSAVNRGWTVEGAYALLCDSAAGPGERVRERSRAHFRSEWERAEEKYRASPPVSDRASGLALINAVERAARAARWNASGGETDRLVLLAHVAIARRPGSVVHNASEREVAELAGRSRSTVSASRRRLIKAGWLRRNGPGFRHFHHAGTWALRLPTAGTLPGHLNPHGGCGTDARGPSHVVWQHGGLGSARLRVYRALASAGGSTVEELAAALERHPKTIERHLRELEAHGLAEHDDRRVWGAVAADLDALAERLGCADLALRRIERHAEERRVYRLLRERPPTSSGGLKLASSHAS